MELLVNLVLVIVVGFLVFSYYRFVFKGRIPQSPAALGRAFAAPTFILALVVYAFSFIQNWVVTPFLGGLPAYEVLSFLAALLLSGAGGWVCSRTVEDTQKMNVKILGVVGVVPYSIVVSIGFVSGPSWVVWWLIAAYFLMLYVGYRAYLKYGMQIQPLDGEAN